MLVAQDSEFIRDLMDVLGLDRTMTRSFTLKAAVDSVVTVTVEQFAAPGAAVTFRTKYKLTKEEIVE